MISIEDVLKLKEAGFTAEEIVTLYKSMEPYEEPAEPAAPAEPAPDRTDEILQALQALTKSVQAANIRTGGGEPPKNESIEDILNYAMNGGNKDGSK